MAAARYTPSISDEAVAAKTGCTWVRWFKALDFAGARGLDHKGIVAILSTKFRVGPWWRQMITVEYERSRGKRQVHQQPGGFTVNISRTMAAPAGRLFDAWKHPATRRRWLGGGSLTIRAATRPKSLRITWRGATNVDVGIAARGRGKSQVAVEHSKLANRAAVERARAFWKKRLSNLEAMVTG